MITRRAAREMALQELYQSEFKGPIPKSSKNLEATSDSDADYSKDLVNGVIHHRSEIDSLIQIHSRNWKIERMSLVDRNILRIAVFEMKFASSPVPFKSVINEAIELGKKFGSQESGGFINGILDQTVKGEGNR